MTPSRPAAVIVLAAGEGTRMKSAVPKVLHEIGGRSMVGHVLLAVQALEPARIVAVVGHQRDQVGPHIQALVPDATLAVQEEQHGTGHAVRVAMDALASAGTTTGTPKPSGTTTTTSSPTTTRPTTTTSPPTTSSTTSTTTTTSC